MDILNENKAKMPQIEKFQFDIEPFAMTWQDLQSYLERLRNPINEEERLMVIITNYFLSFSVIISIPI